MVFHAFPLHQLFHRDSMLYNKYGHFVALNEYFLYAWNSHCDGETSTYIVSPLQRIRSMDPVHLTF